jgi:heat shock protein HslJ/membrane-bound inhibitor of C-type lysozyme
MLVLRLAALAAVLGMLTGCGQPADTGPGPEERLMIRGELFYPERIALPPNSVALVELREIGTAAPVLAEQRQELDGRQVPIGFELSLDVPAEGTGGSYVLRGAILSMPGPARLTEAVRIEARSGTVDVGALRLRPAEQVAFGTPYLCGDVKVIFGALGAHERMIVSGQPFDMAPAVSASGARYEDVDGTDTSFWSRGDRALVTVRGDALPECTALAEPQLPFVARGQEPGWRLEIGTEEILLSAEFGALELRLPRPEPQITAEGVLYEAAADGRLLSVSVQPRICADIATGMPHPFRVRYRLDGETRSGCGGDPKSLLTGEEWEVESIGGEPVVEESTVTIQFLDENRVAGNASCNRYTGGFQLTGEGLSFSQMASTLMACASEALGAQEARFLSLLQDVYRFEIDPEGRLVLHTAREGGIVARR